MKKFLFLCFVIVISSFITSGQFATRTYLVTLRYPWGSERTFECPADRYIYDVAVENGCDLSCSDRCGASSTCISKIISGSVDQSEQCFLDFEDLHKGWVLICVAYPESDCTLEVFKEEEYLGGGSEFPSHLRNGCLKASNGGSAVEDFTAGYKVDLDLNNNSTTGAQVSVSVHSPYTAYSTRTQNNKTWAIIMSPYGYSGNSYIEQLSNKTTSWRFELSCSADNANVSYSFTNPLARF